MLPRSTNASRGHQSPLAVASTLTLTYLCAVLNHSRSCILILLLFVCALFLTVDAFFFFLFPSLYETRCRRGAPTVTSGAIQTHIDINTLRIISRCFVIFALFLDALVLGLVLIFLNRRSIYIHVVRITSFLCHFCVIPCPSRSYLWCLLLFRSPSRTSMPPRSTIARPSISTGGLPTHTTTWDVSCSTRGTISSRRRGSTVKRSRATPPTAWPSTT